MMTQASTSVSTRGAEIHDRSAMPTMTESLHPGDDVSSSQHPLPGRQAVGPLLERSFPGVFQSLADLRRASEWSGWRTAIRPLRAVAARASALVRTWRERSHERWVLTRMSERELHDLGLTRLQIFHEVNKPFWRA